MQCLLAHCPLPRCIDAWEQRAQASWHMLAVQPFKLRVGLSCVVLHVVCVFISWIT